MSDSTTKRVKVPKPEKKKSKSTDTTTPTTTTPINTTADSDNEATEEPLIDIPAVKKKKERRVKTEEDIAAKQERKKLRKEAEEVKKAAQLAKKEAQLAKKGLAAQKIAIQNKTPKWKQFLANTSEADNAEKLKDTSFKVKGDDGSDDDSDSDNDTKSEKKRKAEKDSQDGAKNFKKYKQEELASLDTSSPGLAYLVEWKRSRATWKFQKLRQVWLLNNMYDDKQIPTAHWGVFLEYIHDLKGAARNTAVDDARKIVESPEPEGEENNKEEAQDQEMEEESTIPLSEEEKAAEEKAKQDKIEAKRVAEVKSSRALDILRVLA
ncbi:hypothetical protein BGZ76_002125 [Entomortierella beljakovae]|nr:hypothetical protein BGZ76_002125 [Entomortierella beljakovae]